MAATLGTLPPLTSEVGTRVPALADLPGSEAPLALGMLPVGQTRYAVSAWGSGDKTLLLLTGVRGAEYGLMPHVTQRYSDVTTYALVNVGRRGGWTTPRWAQGLVWVLTADGRFGYVR